MFGIARVTSATRALWALTSGAVPLRSWKKVWASSITTQVFASEPGADPMKMISKAKKPVMVNPYSTGITLQLIPKASVDKIPVLSMAYGLSASAVGNEFPWIFNPPATYWDGLTRSMDETGLARMERDLASARTPTPLPDSGRAFTARWLELARFFASLPPGADLERANPNLVGGDNVGQRIGGTLGVDRTGRADDGALDHHGLHLQHLERGVEAGEAATVDRNRSFHVVVTDVTEAQRLRARRVLLRRRGLATAGRDAHQSWPRFHRRDYQRRNDE